MSPKNPEPVAIAILTKAPLPGFAKTRLIPALGADGAALLQARLITHAATTAQAAAIGPVTVWATPDASHPELQKLAATGLELTRQPGGDLGARMLAAMQAHDGPGLVIGSDCPALSAQHLRDTAGLLRDGIDVVIVPAEDGGYALIGSRRPHPALFADMTWSNAGVMTATRRRLARLGLSWREPARLWDVDLPPDLDRLGEIGLQHLIPSPGTSA